MPRINSGVLELNVNIDPRKVRRQIAADSTLPRQNRPKIPDHEIPFKPSEIVEEWVKKTDPVINDLSDEMNSLMDKVDKLESDKESKKLGKETVYPEK